MDDLDDLLEDFDDSIKKKPAAGKQQARPNTSVAKASKPKQEDDDEWGDFGLDDQPAAGKLGATGGKSDGLRQPTFGYGGADGLKKVPVTKQEEEDEWGLGPTTKTGFGGRLLGRKPKKDDDDELDNFLDDLEAKRGVENSKPKPEPDPLNLNFEEKPATKARPKTAGFTAPADLDDIDDGASQQMSQMSGRGPSDGALAAKRRALFGGGNQAPSPSGEGVPPRAVSAPKREVAMQPK